MWIFYFFAPFYESMNWTGRSYQMPPITISWILALMPISTIWSLHCQWLSRITAVLFLGRLVHSTRDKVNTSEFQWKYSKKNQNVTKSMTQDDYQKWAVSMPATKVFSCRRKWYFVVVWKNRKCQLNVNKFKWRTLDVIV